MLCYCNRYLFFLVIAILLAGKFIAQNKSYSNQLQKLKTLPEQIAIEKKDTSRAWAFTALLEKLYRQKPDTAIILAKELLKFSTIIKYKNGIAAGHGWLGYLLEQTGRISEALNHQMENLKIKEGLHDKSGIGEAIMNLGFIYNRQGDTEKALEYYQRALRIFKDLGNKDNLASAINNLAMIYDKKRDYKKSILYFEKSLEIARQINDSQSVAVALHNLGCSYRDFGNFEKSIKYITEAKLIRENIHDKLGIIGSQITMADIHLKSNDLKLAETAGVKALNLSKEMGYVSETMGAADVLYDIYKKQNNYKSALAMFELKIQMGDSIRNQETHKSSIKQQLKYEYEKQAAADSVAHAKESEIKNVQLQKQTAEIKAKKNQQYALFGGLGLVIIFAGFMFNRFKVTQKQKTIIEQQKKVVEEQKHLVDEKQKEVMDSIRYAKRIQTAQLPSEKKIMKSLERLMKF